MPSRSFATTAAVLLATIRLASSSTFTIKNSCSEDISVNKCQNGDHWLPDVPAGQSSDSQSFGDTTSAGTGVSYKIYPASSKVGTPMQFEYSAGTGDGQIWFDLSNIDGYPQMFVDGGVTITPSGSGSNCKDIVCPKGERHCTDAYNVWNDDQKAMRNCDIGCDVVVELCSGGTASGGGDNGNGNDNNNDNGNDNSDNSENSSSGNNSPPPSYNPPVVKAADNQENNNDNSNNNEATPLKESDGGKVYVPQQQQNGAFTTVVVAATETMTVMGGEPTGKMMHRRHVHGHAHHHA